MLLRFIKRNVTCTVHTYEPPKALANLKERGGAKSSFLISNAYIMPGGGGCWVLLLTPNPFPKLQCLILSMVSRSTCSLPIIPIPNDTHWLFRIRGEWNWSKHNDINVTINSNFFFCTLNMFLYANKNKHYLCVKMNSSKFSGKPRQRWRLKWFFKI